jgi:hypothetical protein
MQTWPWTVNAEGQGSFYDTKAQAVAAVRALQARGVRSIDVGCMPVNLMHHPDAFASLEAAFDPTANAAYAARFLRDLHAQGGAQGGDWSRAVTLYHSATPNLAADYQRSVLAVWPVERRPAGGAAHIASRPALPTGAGSVAPGGMALSHGGVPPTMPRTAAPIGRNLAAYRAAPVLLAIRPPVSAGGLIRHAPPCSPGATGSVSSDSLPAQERARP